MQPKTLSINKPPGLFVLQNNSPMKDRFPKKYDPSFEQALYHEREQA